MMRFYNYLTESTEEWLKEIESNCKPFLNDLKRIGNPDSLLYSGRKSYVAFIKNKIRKNRVPTDTPQEIHEWFDKWFEYKFGVKARSQSLFATPEKEAADSYGSAFIIFPAKNYKIIWSSEVADLYGDLIGLYNRDIDNLIKRDPDDVETAKDINKNLLKDLNTYREGNLKEALLSGNEIMLVCEQYYGINLQFGPDEDRLLEWFDSLGIKVHPSDLYI